LPKINILSFPDIPKYIKIVIYGNEMGMLWEHYGNVSSTINAFFVGICWDNPGNVMGMREKQGKMGWEGRS
jgi:hypothetical protein